MQIYPPASCVGVVRIGVSCAVRSPHHDSVYRRKRIYFRGDRLLCRLLSESKTFVPAGFQESFCFSYAETLLVFASGMGSVCDLAPPADSDVIPAPVPHRRRCLSCPYRRSPAGSDLCNLVPSETEIFIICRIVELWKKTGGA